jgi:hypothetical protein
MTISLYDISVKNYQQTLGAVGGFLEKGLAHCRERGLDPEAIVNTRLHPDMLPFRFQIHSVAHHSAGAIAALESCVFRPDRGLQTADYAALQSEIAEARKVLEKLTPEAVNSHEDGEVVFEAGELRRRFKAQNFVLSFSLPNFYFHAATAYDILRSLGLPIGKRDYMGTLRMES